MPTTVALVRAERYDSGIVYAAIERAFSLTGGVAELEKKGRTLLLKPNILSGADPSRAITTHPVFFEAVVVFLREKGFKLIAGDSPAVESTDHAGKRSGLRTVAIRHGIEWSDFSESVTVSNPDGRQVRRFTVAKAFTRADAVISLPKLKNHSQMYYTGAMKNIFGFVPGLEKSRFHLRFPERERFARMIVDLNLLIRPAFSLMDGITAMEGPGPNNGRPIDIGAIIASSDPLALDSVACRIIGYDPAEIPILRVAYEVAAWVENEADIAVSGDPVESFIRPFEKIDLVKEISFFKREFFRRGLLKTLAPLAERLFVPKPFIIRKKCILCERCVKICQTQAIVVSGTGNDRHISIDLSPCIRCYCCHEVCPADAIDLKRRLF